MSFYTQHPYTLPSIDFVGGETQDLAFYVYMQKTKRPFNLSGCTCTFAVVGFCNKNGSAVILKPMQIEENDTNGVPHIASVVLESDETFHLSGKYIYQISITDADGNTEIPNQGILYIAKNINQQMIV